MNVAQAKKLPIFEILAALGHHPVRTYNNGDVWYLSPFRNEKTASFKINIKGNIWYDHGEGVGGNNIDFAQRFNNLGKNDVSGALKFLESTRLGYSIFSTIRLNPKEPTLFDRPMVENEVPEILEIKPVFSYPLKNYLAGTRFIKPEFGYKYLREICYKLGSKEYYALGFQNRAGGWELRNELFQNAISPKDITIIESGYNRVHVFEGFMDFLTCLTVQDNDRMGGDVVVMNSVNLKSRALEFVKAKGYSEVYTYFDNDKAGEKALELFKAELPKDSVIPCNDLYEGFKDYNKYWQELMKEKNKNTLSR